MIPAMCSDCFAVHFSLRQGQVDGKQGMHFHKLTDDSAMLLSVDQVNEQLIGFEQKITSDEQLISVEAEDISFVLDHDGAAMMAQIILDTSHDIFSVNEHTQSLLAGRQLGRCLLVQVTAGEDLLSSDFELLGKQWVKLSSAHTNIKIGLKFDESLEDRIVMHLIATGLGTNTITDKSSSV